MTVYIVKMAAKFKVSLFVIVVICTINISDGKLKKDYPPHCTVVTKGKVKSF